MKDNVSALPGYPPDPRDYPLFANAAVCSCTLQPGDALYIPYRWWHWVTSYDRNVALNFWHAADRSGDWFGRQGVLNGQIPAVSDTTGFAAEWFARKRPVVIRSSSIAEWPALSRWTDDYLIENGGSGRHPVGVSPDPQLFPVKGPHRTRLETMTLEAFVSAARDSSERMYLAQNEAIPAALAADFTIPPFWAECFADRRFRMVFWFTYGGSEGVTSALHFDYYENLLVQVAGTKRVLLFAPAETPNLYPLQAEALAR